jgi:ABC-2 type transport system permease protein
MNKILLKCLAFLNPALSKIGVNTDQLHLILKIKLMIDRRRPNGMFAASRNTKKVSDNTTQWMTSIFMLVAGAMISIVLLLDETPYVGQTFYFLIFMVMMSMTLISDFTTVLIDTKDHYILLPRPVNDRTIAVSRILHITIYILKLSLLQGLPGLIMVGFLDGILAVPLFFIQILEATFLSILLVNMVYLGLMKFVSPQKFKDSISYFQIGFSIAIFGSYYLLPRLINISALQHISLIKHWWSYLLPPVWIAALNELFIHSGRAGIPTIILAIVGLVLPIAGLWLVAKVLAPGFNRRLAILATSEGNSDVKDNLVEAKRFNWINKAANFLVKDPVENAGFRITVKLAARTRDFKMKVYPALAYVPIYFLYFALNGKADSVSERVDNLQRGHTYVFLIYLCTFVLISILSNITMSDKYKSSWVYYALPIGEPGKILSGMYKGILTFYFFPYCLIIALITVAVWGPAAINDIILAFLMSIIYGMIMALFLVKGLPFSKPVVTSQGGGKFVVSLIFMSIVGTFSYAHYFFMKWETLIWVMIVPVLVLNFVMFYYYRRQTWKNIEMSEM